MKEKVSHPFGLAEHIGKISSAKFKESVVLWPEAAGIFVAGLAAGVLEAAVRTTGVGVSGLVRGVGATVKGALHG